jgi:hypothetical protein
LTSGLSLKKKQKKKRASTLSTSVTLDHLAFMEANVMACEREVDALCMLKAAETKVAVARAKREDIDVIFSPSKTEGSRKSTSQSSPY